jgi:cytosine deaminase
MANKVPYLDLKQEILQKIKKNGGWVNAHAHFDRAFTINKENFRHVNATLQEKWNLNDDLKRNSTVDTIYDRMAQSIELMLEQGVQAVGTFIDVDDRIQDKAIKAAQRTYDKYKSAIQIKYINQVHYGVLDAEARRWFDLGAEFVDIIGGLPEKDKGNEAEHLDILFSTAKRMGKMAHVHIDQFNDPEQKDTELLAKKTIEYGMQGQVVGIHGISIGAQKKEYRQELYKLMKEADLMMIASPLGWIDTRRNETLMPFHNALTPVDELIPAGLTVAIGTDNIADIYKPFINGSMWEELHALIEVSHFYEVDEMVKVATVNGQRVLGIK